jgi:SAM-dependent methyltransferase
MSQEYFDTRLIRDPAESKVWKAIVDHLHQTVLPQNLGTTLDIGCGYGDFSRHIRANRRIALDQGDLKQHQGQGVEFYRCLVSELKKKISSSIEDGIDLAFASNLLEHLSREQGRQFIEDVKALLKPGGLFILLQPNFRFCYRNYFDDYTHETIYTDEGLKGALQAQGFDVTHMKPRYLPFSMRGGLLPKTYWLTKCYLDLGSPILGAQMLAVARKPLS